MRTADQQVYKDTLAQLSPVVQAQLEALLATNRSTGESDERD